MPGARTVTAVNIYQMTKNNCILRCIVLQRAFVLSSVNGLGSKNGFLGIAYLLCGVRRLQPVLVDCVPCLPSRACSVAQLTWMMSLNTHGCFVQIVLFGLVNVGGVCW